MTPTYETPRLKIRPVRTDDLDQFHSLINDPDVAAKTPSIPHPISRKRAKQWVEYYNDSTVHGADLHWAICLKPEEKLIGVINLYDVAEDQRHSEIGFWIGKRYWNKGYTTEAIRAVIKYATEETKLEIVIANHHPENFSSHHILEKTGFITSKTVRMKDRKRNDWVVMKQMFLDLSHSSVSLRGDAL